MWKHACSDTYGGLRKLTSEHSQASVSLCKWLALFRQNISCCWQSFMRASYQKNCFQKESWKEKKEKKNRPQTITQTKSCTPECFLVVQLIVAVFLLGSTWGTVIRREELRPRYSKKKKKKKKDIIQNKNLDMTHRRLEVLSGILSWHVYVVHQSTKARIEIGMSATRITIKQMKETLHYPQKP